MKMSSFNSANDGEIIDNAKSVITNKLNEPLSDLLFDEAEAKNLRLRLYLMLQVLDYMRREQLTEQQAVKKLKVSPVTIEYLTKRKINLLTTDLLLNMLENAGANIYEQLTTITENKNVRQL